MKVDPTPREIANSLREQVIGQEDAIRSIAVALAKRFAGLAVGNILMIGPSGTGKTTLMRAVESYLASDPELEQHSSVVRVHANILAEEADSGRPGERLLQRIYHRARSDLGKGAPLADLLYRVGHGIVFVDEIDKIRARVGGDAHIPGIRAQEALLTLMENEAVPFRLPAGEGGETATVDSRNVLFVAAGAFDGLYDAVYDRVTIGQDRGALKPVTVVENGQVHEQTDFSLRSWLSTEDLFEYGMSPQFLSRFDTTVLLHELTEDQLIQIFLESPDSDFLPSRDFFARLGIDLKITTDAVRAIAQQAVRQRRLGARALKEVFRRSMRDYEFDPVAAAADNVLVIDRPEIEAAFRER
ncbi:MAG: AAA family ATPase [Acidobacteriota bacterium]|nr:AAA family ATPase [Acidobacteriota bacterium]